MYFYSHEGVGPQANCKMSYYTTADRETVPKGVIPLHGASVSMPRVDPDAHPEWVDFAVQTAAGKIYPLRASTVAERKEWFDYITAAIERSTSSTSSTTTTTTSTSSSMMNKSGQVSSNRSVSAVDNKRTTTNYLENFNEAVRMSLPHMSFKEAEEEFNPNMANDCRSLMVRKKERKNKSSNRTPLVYFWCLFEKLKERSFVSLP
jgi:hypothetical protein